MPLICTGLCIYLRSHQKKFQSFSSHILAGPAIFVNTKDFRKNTKENMASICFRSHFLQDAPINLILSPDCYICTALSIDTHIGYSGHHLEIRSYGHMAVFWPYGHMTIWLYDFRVGQYGCLWKELYKCSNLVKELG